METTARTEMPTQTALSFLRWLNIPRSIKGMRLSIKRSIPMNIFLLCTASAVAVGAARITATTLALRAELRSAESQLGDMVRKKQELSRRLEEQDTPEAVEYQAKARMNLKNPGEEVVVVVPDERPAPPETSAGFWQSVRDFFARIF